MNSSIAAATVFLLAGAVSHAAAQDVVPPERRTDWTPGLTVGVPGGIPHRTVIGAVVDSSLYGRGTLDASAALGNAIDAAPHGSVVYIPSGTYRLDDRVYRAYAGNITIRGAGPGKTILKSNNSSEVLLLGTADWPRATAGISVLSGASKGNTILSVANASSIVVGNLVRIEQNDLPYVISAGSPSSNNSLLTAMFRVTAKTASTVTVTPPVPFDFTLSPRLVQYALPPLVATGVEDLTVDCDSTSWTGIEFDQSWGCWISNVEIRNSTSRQIFLYCFVAGEIRHNYTHDVLGGGPNHEGIDLYQDCSFNLIEDNIAYNGGFPGIILGDSQGGCAGNVIAYNFSYAANTGAATTAGMDISVSHGPHNMMNLVEGNIAGGMGSDGYFGSTSHITVARNWFTATHPTADQNLIAVNVGRWNNYFSVVGNILGSSSFSGAGLLQPESPFSYATPVIWKLGFPNMGNNGFSMTWGPTVPPDYSGQSLHQVGGDSHGTGGNSLQELDLNVKSTMIRHGNYDYLSHAVSWDGSIASREIPPSYFRASKPAYFGNLAWPPFDPASPPGAVNESNLSRIPAGYRYVHGTDPLTSADDGSAAVPSESKLYQNFPNPFNPTTTIRFQVRRPGMVTLTIVDILGRVVATVARGMYPAGSHQVLWNASGVASGVYYARIVVRDEQGSAVLSAVHGLILAK